MISKTTIDISARLAEMATSLAGDTLNDSDKDELYEDVFNFYRSLLKRYDSETVNAIDINLISYGV